MKNINIKKGYTQVFDVESRLEKAISSKEVALTPSRIPFIKPKLLVKKGDLLKIGSPVFFDKRNPEIKFLSPAGGVVKNIVFGERRVIKKILIVIEKEEYEQFESINHDKISKTDRADLVKHIINGGLWPLFRELPYRDYPNKDKIPPQIIVNLNSPEPEGPSPSVYLENEENNFFAGLEILNKLSDKTFIISDASDEVPDQIDKLITHKVAGNYPANDPGTFLYHIKKNIPENSSWYIFGQDLIMIAKLVLSGKYPTDKVVTVSGSMNKDDNLHYRVRVGAPLNDLVKHTFDDFKIIQGGVFRGYDTSDTPYSGYFENSFNLLKKEGEDALFGFVMPGFKKNTVSKTFFSFLNTGTREIECSLNGEERACVNCGTCSKFCPVDMFPNITYKAVYADEVEEAIFSGLLDCVECGVCSFVCPSKIELAKDLKNAKSEYYKEQV
ncbi:MAG: 4Fe-4S dicluster domain-containing protein [Deltaproteobacteria bacterium]|nr:4Fe-4S dicluster domain-containing protein [Deltaproteobacteria bacterium]